MARIGQNLGGVQPDQGRTFMAIPPGPQTVKIIASEYKQTNAGDGMCLGLTLEVVGGEHNGRRLFEYLTLEHPKQKTVEIAQAKLKAIALACRLQDPDRVEDSNELHDIPFEVDVIRQRAKQGYGDADGQENRIVGYSAPGAQQRRPAAVAAGRGDGDIPF